MTLKEKYAEKLASGLLEQAKERCPGSNVMSYEAAGVLMQESFKGGWDMAMEFARISYRCLCPSRNSCKDRVGKSICTEDCLYVKMFNEMIKD